MFKKILRYVGTGLAIGWVATSLCLCGAGLLLEGAIHPVLIEVMAWMGASAAYGLASLLFEKESLSRPAATALHMVICLGVTLLVAAGLGYGAGWPLFLGVTPLFLVIYGVIYGAFYFHDREWARKANRRLRD